MATVDIKGALGIGDFQLFSSSYLNIIFVILITVFIFALVIVLVFLRIRAKQYKYKIHLYTKVGNIPTRIGIPKAKEVPFGRAGDKLWYVKGSGFTKWIAPGSIQSAKNEFWYWVREDGEWINFSMQDLDELSKKAGVSYVKQEARLTRLAIDQLLEKRLSGKSFWEQWGLVIGYVIFFLVIAIALVVFFHQYSKVTDQIAGILDKADQILEKANRMSGNSNSGELTPAYFIPLFKGGLTNGYPLG